MRRRADTLFQGWRIVLNCTEFRCQDGKRSFASTAVLRHQGRRSVVFPEEAFETPEDANVDATSRAKREIMGMDGGGVATKAESADQLLAAQYEISFDGLRYAFRQYRYDAFGDALRYAVAEHGKAGFVHDAAFRPHWRTAYHPTDADEHLMRQYAIAFSAGRFHYGGYRYEKLRDAVAYAVAHPGYSSATVKGPP